MSVARDSLEHATLIDLGESENALNPASVERIESRIEGAAAAERPVVLTASGRHWSTGLDLAWMRDHPSEADALIDAVHALVARLVVSPMVTVAAINGHAIGAGAMLALACDLRVMREDRGYFAFPEVDLKLPPTSAMIALVSARTGRSQAAFALLSGARYTARDALDVGLVDRVASLEQLVPTAGEMARPFAGKGPPNGADDQTAHVGRRGHRVRKVTLPGAGRPTNGRPRRAEHGCQNSAAGGPSAS